MEAIKNYFGSLQKYFKTNEILDITQSSDYLKIISKITPSKLVQLLQANREVFESNFKNALLKIFPNQTFNIKYSRNSIIGNVKVFTYFDMIPQEMIIEIASYFKFGREVLKLNDILNDPIKNLTNKIILHLMPELYKWIIPNREVTPDEYNEIHFIYRNLNSKLIGPTQFFGGDPEKQKYIDKWKNKTIKEFLVDTTANIVPYDFLKDLDSNEVY